MSDTIQRKLSFDAFVWWGEDRNPIEYEIKMDIMMILMELVGWLEFNRSHGNIIRDSEYEANNPFLQILIKAHTTETVMEYNNTVPRERQLSISQRDINFIQEDNELYIAMDFYLLNNLKKLSIKMPIK